MSRKLNETAERVNQLADSINQLQEKGFTSTLFTSSSISPLEQKSNEKMTKASSGTETPELKSVKSMSMTLSSPPYRVLTHCIVSTTNRELLASPSQPQHCSLMPTIALLPTAFVVAGLIACLRYIYRRTTSLVKHIRGPPSPSFLLGTVAI